MKFFTFPTFTVTDKNGNSYVYANKQDALGIANLFRSCGDYDAGVAERYEDCPIINGNVCIPSYIIR